MQIDGERVDTVTDYFLDSKITTDSYFRHEIKRRLLLGRKVMTNLDSILFFFIFIFLDSILKSRGITLPTNIHLVKAMVFPVVLYGCKIWTVKLSPEELILLNCDVGEDS